MVGKVVEQRPLVSGSYQYRIETIRELFYSWLLSPKKEHVFHNFWVDECPFKKKKFIDGLVRDMRDTKYSKVWEKLKRREPIAPEKVVFT